MYCYHGCSCLGKLFGFFFFKQKTAYEMRISDWSSDVCSSDLLVAERCGCAPQKSQSPRIVSAANRSAAGISSSINHKSGSDRRRLAQYSVISSSLSVFCCSDDTSVPAPSKSSSGSATCGREEERRVCKNCVSTCKSGWSQIH